MTSFKDYYEKLHEAEKNMMYSSTKLKKKHQKNQWKRFSGTIKDFEHTSYTKFNLETAEGGFINGPWPEVLEAYKELSEYDEPECSKCDVEMMEGDRAFICQCCNNKYQIGTGESYITCFRPDVRRACVERVEVPDKYMDSYPVGGVDSAKGGNIIFNPSTHTVKTKTAGGINFDNYKVQGDIDIDADEIIEELSSNEDE